MRCVSETATKNLLLLSYWYPPAVGAAAERMRSFATYLPEHGWRVTVVCADRGDGAGDAMEESTTIVRIPDPMAKAGPLFADFDPRQPGTPAWKKLLKRFVFPDRFVRWKKAAIEKVGALCVETRFDMILASFPPASVVQLALEAKAIAKAPLTLDFRDRWLGPGGYEPDSAKIREKHCSLEREAVQSASAILAVSENMANAIAEENGVDRSRVHVIPNGYEPIADWDASQSEVNEGADAAATDVLAHRPMTIAHVGTVIARNQPEDFFASLQAITGQSALGDVRFRFVGNLSRDYVSSLGLSGVVETTGLVDRDTARREMRDADALLLLVGDYVGRWGHNAKVFEYVQAGRPILCLEQSPGGNDSELLRRFVGDRTFVAPLGDSSALAEAIERLRSYVKERPAPAIELGAGFRSYSRQALAGELAAALSRIG